MNNMLRDADNTDLLFEYNEVRDIKENIDAVEASMALCIWFDDEHISKIRDLQKDVENILSVIYKELDKRNLSDIV